MRDAALDAKLAVMAQFPALFIDAGTGNADAPRIAAYLAPPKDAT